MPRDANGNMTLVTGNPVVADTAISSDVFNRTIADLAAEIQASLSRDGKGGLNTPLLFADGNESNPSIAFVNDTDTGFYISAAGDLRAAVAGAWRLRLGTASAALSYGLTLSGAAPSITATSALNIDVLGGNALYLRGEAGANRFSVSETTINCYSRKLTGLPVAVDSTDAVSNSVTASTVTTYGTSWASGGSNLAKAGRVCSFGITALVTGGGASKTAFCTLPEGFLPTTPLPRPVGTIYDASANGGNGYLYPARFKIYADGTINIEEYYNGTAFVTPFALAAGDYVDLYTTFAVAL